jgi:hypothetical protein
MLSKTELNQISKLFSKMEGEDFRTVVSLFKQTQNSHQANLASNLSVGQKVSFTCRHGYITGTVEKINRKTVKVKTEDAMYSVSPSLLQLA